MDKRIKKVLTNAVSPYRDRCDGQGNPTSKTGDYLLGTVIEVGVAPISLSHDGSSMLDKINAFDMAERNSSYIGQVNMSIVSSFCGPRGVIWGYDVARPKKQDQKIKGLESVSYNGKKAPVYSIQPMLAATEALFGTVNDKRLHLMPGAHVPFASKNIKKIGPARLYSCLAIGIAKERDKEACLLMEDVGEIPMHLSKSHLKTYHRTILKKAAKSVLVIGENQNVEYEKILVGLKDCDVRRGEIGCALVAAPYFTMASGLYEEVSTEGLMGLGLKEVEGIIKSVL